LLRGRRNKSMVHNVANCELISESWNRWRFFSKKIWRPEEKNNPTGLCHVATEIQQLFHVMTSLFCWRRSNLWVQRVWAPCEEAAGESG
jgi:hypothetical protein